MSLRAIIANGVDAAWAGLGDIPQPITLRRVSSTYNPSTGTSTTTNTDYLIAKGILTKYAEFEVDKVSVMSTDRKLILRKKDVTIVLNTSSDRVLIGTTVFNIIRVTEDPAGATYTVQLRSA